MSDVEKKLIPPQTLWGVLVPTALSDHAWDYEVQSENQPNPQLEELNKKNNRVFNPKNPVH